MLTIEQVARVCHETNRAYCESIGDTSQKSWEQAEKWQRDSTFDAVKQRLANPDAPLYTQHDIWVQQKVVDGWTWGPEKDATLKTHPCLVPYEELPWEQQAKDYLIASVINGLAKFVEQ